METGLFKIDLDLSQLQAAINDAVDKAIERHSFQSQLKPLLTKNDLMDLLEIGATKASELLNREDFPVTREFGHPRVPSHLLLIWIEEHTDWVRDNAGANWKLRGGVA